MIDIGCYIEAAIEWLAEEGAFFFDALNVGVVWGTERNVY